MKKTLFWAPLLWGALSAHVLAGDYEWTGGWGMGVTEYSTSDGNNNALYIACPDYDDAVSAIATIEGQEYYSDQLAGGAGFDVIVDGETFSNPFFTDCRVCGANFPAFWQAFRQANNLYVVADGVQSKLPTAQLASVVAPLDSDENTCRAAW